MTPNTPQPFAPLSPVPRGLGMWVLDISKRVMGTPEEAAQKAVDHGLSWVALAACWQDGPGKHAPMNVDDLDDYGRAFRKAGIMPWVWGYPWHEPDQIRAFVARMRLAADQADAVGIILDPELGFRGQPEAMRELLKRTVDSLSETLGLGFSSYGLPSSMRDFPWPETVLHAYGWGSPQCYQMPLKQAREGIRQWSAFGWHDLVVSLPTFGRNTEDDSGKSDTAEMIAYCAALLELTGGAGCFWSWATTSAAEWKAIRTLSQMESFQGPPIVRTRGELVT